MQSTEEGARFLGKPAQPLANYSNLVLFDQQMRHETSEHGKYEWDLMEKTLELLQISSNSFDHFSQSKFSPKVPLNNKQVYGQELPTISTADIYLLNAAANRCGMQNEPFAELLGFHERFKCYQSDTSTVQTE